MTTKMIGTGSYLPEHVVTNDDLVKLVDTSDEWIASRTGIRNRRIATKERGRYGSRSSKGSVKGRRDGWIGD